MKREYFKLPSKDRRDECILAKILMLWEVHSGERRCTDVMKDEAPFKPLTPFDLLQAPEKNIRKEALRQYCHIRNCLVNLLDYPGCQEGSCFRVSDGVLPDFFEEAYLFSNRGYKYAFIKTKDCYILLRDGKIRIHELEENVPNTWPELLEHLRANPQLQYI